MHDDNIGIVRLECKCMVSAYCVTKLISVPTSRLLRLLQLAMHAIGVACHITGSLLTCSSTNAKAEQHSAKNAQRPHKEQPSADDVLRRDLFRQGLSKVHNHSHGLDQWVEEQLAIRVELS